MTYAVWTMPEVRHVDITDHEAVREAVEFLRPEPYHITVDIERLSVVAWTSLISKRVEFFVDVKQRSIDLYHHVDQMVKATGLIVDESVLALLESSYYHTLMIFPNARGGIQVSIDLPTPPIK